VIAEGSRQQPRPPAPTTNNEQQPDGDGNRLAATRTRVQPGRVSAADRPSRRADQAPPPDPGPSCAASGPPPTPGIPPGPGDSWPCKRRRVPPCRQRGRAFNRRKASSRAAGSSPQTLRSGSGHHPHRFQYAPTVEAEGPGGTSSTSPPPPDVAGKGATSRFQNQAADPLEPSPEVGVAGRTLGRPPPPPPPMKALIRSIGRGKMMILL